MAERKYQSEFGLNMMATDYLLLQQSELAMVKDAPFVHCVFHAKPIIVSTDADQGFHGKPIT